MSDSVSVFLCLSHIFLNTDLQSRGGCFCAGPNMQTLLGRVFGGITNYGKHFWYLGIRFSTDMNDRYRLKPNL